MVSVRALCGSSSWSDVAPPPTVAPRASGSPDNFGSVAAATAAGRVGQSVLRRVRSFCAWRPILVSFFGSVPPHRSWSRPVAGQKLVDLAVDDVGRVEMGPAPDPDRGGQETRFLGGSVAA